MMVLLDGGRSGKAGSLCKRFLKAFTLLFISVCKMWVRISPGAGGGGLWWGAPAAGRAIRTPLGSGAERAAVVGDSARAGSPGAAAGGAGHAEVTCADAGSRGRAAPPQPDRARATPGELHAALGSAGVCERPAHRRGEPRDRAGSPGSPPRAWTLPGPCQGIRAEGPGAAAGGPPAHPAAEPVSGASRRAGVVALPARAAAR